MSRSHRLWTPGYLVALFLVAAPVTDLFLRVRPLEPSSVEWRYGATGFISLSLEAPLMGLFLALLVAGVLRHYTAARILGGVAFLASLGLLGLGAVFAMDAQQMRSMLNPVLLGSFQLSVLIGLTKYGCAVLLAGLLGWAGLKLAQRS